MQDANTVARVEEIAERLMDLEVRLAYSDRLVGELGEVIREFSTRLAAAEAKVAMFERSSKGMSEGGPALERPPHY